MSNLCTKNNELCSFQRNTILLVSFFLGFIFLSADAAVTYTWYGGAGDWEIATNWNPNHVPNNITNDSANIISSGGRGYACNINSNISIFTPIFGIGSGLNTDAPCTVNINTGATLTTSNELIISLSDNSYAITNVYGTSNLASLRIAGENSNTKGVLNIDGGNVQVKDFGTYIGCRFTGVDSGGQGIVNILNNGTLILNGTGSTGNPLDFGSRGQINIEEGTLAVKGSKVSLLQGYIDNGKIASYGGKGVLTCYLSNGYTYVKTYNLLPSVDAGLPVMKVFMDLPATVELNGAVVSDDGRPNPPASVSVLWTVEDAPVGATVEFIPSANVLNPAVVFGTMGNYILRLTANDGANTSQDEIIFMVYPEDYLGLLAHWSFDEGVGSIAHDSAGVSNGTLYGSPAWVPAGGKIGGCIRLDGIDDYIDCGAGVDSTLADMIYQMSISAWIKPSRPFGGDKRTIIAKGDDAWALQWNDELNRIEFTVGGLTAGSVQSQSTFVDFEDEQWHQIFVTYNGDNIAIYVDGINEANIPSGGVINTNEWDVWIGSDAQSVTEGKDCYFDGLIDEIKIYEIGLSLAQVLRRYIEEGGANSCSDYITGDINHDCIIDLKDFAMLASCYMEQ